MSDKENSQNQDRPRRFTRKELEEKLNQAKNGIVEIVIGRQKGHIRAPCLRGFLKEYA